MPKSHPAWNKGLTKADAPNLSGGAPKGRIPWNKGMSAWNKGLHMWSEADKKIMSDRQRKVVGWHHSKKTKSKLKAIMTSPEVNEKIASKLRGPKNPFYGKHHSPNSNAQNAAKHRDLINNNPEYRKKILEAGYKGWLALTKKLNRYRTDGLPNPSESYLGKILDIECPGQYKYNDGWFVLAGKIPDFVNVNGQKKVVDLFGEGYHKTEEESKRKELFATLGWSLMVIWGKELSDPCLGDRIRLFNEGMKSI